VLYRVVFQARARRQLAEIQAYIADRAGLTVAVGYTSAIVEYCERFSAFPLRGTKRDDVLPGLRVLGFRRRVTIAFSIEGEIVSILGVFYGGTDYEAALRGGADQT